MISAIGSVAAKWHLLRHRTRCTGRTHDPRVGLARNTWARRKDARLRSVAHHRVGHELAKLYRAAAGDLDLRRPLDDCLPRGQVQDAEPSVELLGLRLLPAATVPSPATMTGSTLSANPPPNTHTPASMASFTTS